MQDKHKEDLEKLVAKSTPVDDTTMIDKADVELQNKVSSLEKESQEERFLWILIVIALFDANWFSPCQSWGGPIVIGIIEFIFIIVMAARLDIKVFMGTIDRILNIFKVYK